MERTSGICDPKNMKDSLPFNATYWECEATPAGWSVSWVNTCPLEPLGMGRGLAQTTEQNPVSRNTGREEDGKPVCGVGDRRKWEDTRGGPALGSTQVLADFIPRFPRVHS